MIFTVEGKIKGKERPRFSRGHTYTPKATIEAERAIKKAYRSNSTCCLESFVRIEIYAFFKMRKSYTKKKARECLENVYCDLMPDADNIAKTVCDALNGVAYVDDKQVVECVVVKKWTEEEERLEIEVSEI